MGSSPPTVKAERSPPRPSEWKSAFGSDDDDEVVTAGGTIVDARIGAGGSRGRSAE
jgi:hypothetical protein